MKLYATDQVSVSAVQADSLRPGQEFEVSDALGKELLDKLPHAVSEAAPKTKAKAPARAAKAESAAPKNKAEPKPANKSGGKD